MPRRMTWPRRRRLSADFEEPHQILRLFLDFHLAVAQDAEHALARDREAGKELVEELADHLLERQEADSLAGQADEARDRGRDQEQRLHPVAVAAALQLQRQAQAEIGDEGKGMRRIDGERRQHRENLGLEALGQEGVILGRKLVRLDHRDSSGGHFAFERGPGLLLILHQLAGATVDGGELLRRGQPVLARSRDAGLHLALQAGDPHHVEFVQIVRRNRQEAQPLQQRIARIVGLGQHALVEGEPGQLAIDEPAGRAAFEGFILSPLLASG